MNKEMSFYVWLLLQSKREDPIGDLARDTYRIRNYLGDIINTKEYWKSLLNIFKADSDALKALNDAWAEYEHSV